MGTSQIRLSIIIILASCYCSTKAQSSGPISDLQAYMPAIVDGTIHLDSLDSLNTLKYQRYSPKSRFVKKPDYDKGKEAPIPIPNMYVSAKDASKPIPTLRIQTENKSR
jgi:hypothetical protein